MSTLTETMRILEPYPGIYAYYDGRIEGKRLHSEGPNWVDDPLWGTGTAITGGQVGATPFGSGAHY